MDSQTNIVFRCVEVRQPIGTFYCGAIDARDLFSISYADIRRIVDRDIEKIIGIQRPLNAKRVKELKQYVRNVDASFPTSVILAIDSKHATYSSKTNAMSVTRDPNVAKIIDGQHRIAGLEAHSGSRFEVNVTVFIDMELEDQALTFATINLKQTRVSKSLAYDLYEYASTRSPQKTCHDIARLLNRKEGSPFRNKIKILGTATGQKEETLTQAAFVDRLISYLTTDSMGDRDALKRGKKLERATGTELKHRMFRNLFVDQKDAEIAKILWNYFAAVENRWPEAWPAQVRGNILNRTTGFAALMRFLKISYNAFGELDGVPPIDYFSDIFGTITVTSSEFTPDNFKPGGSGEKALFRRFLDESGLPEIS